MFFLVMMRYWLWPIANNHLPFGGALFITNKQTKKDNAMSKTVTIDGVEYVEKGTFEMPEMPEMSQDYVIVRCRNAGVHAGYLEMRDPHVLRLKNSRRLWRFWSKFTLSGLAMSGVLKGKEDECLFACVLPDLELTCSDVCEVIKCTDKARVSIESIPEHTNE